MRIALFAPYSPAPAISGGRIRIHQLARGLALSHEIVLFCAAAQEELKLEAAQAALRPYSTVYAAMNPMGYLPSFLLPQNRLPRRVVRAAGRSLAHAFKREHARSPFDLGVVEHSHAAKLACDFNLPYLLDEHNIESNYLREQDAAFESLGKSERMEQERLARWESSVWSGARQVVCVSESDAALIRARTSAPCDVVANGVELSEIEFLLPSQRTSKNVLFVGLMNHSPNVQAALLLAREVMPLVWQREPEAHLVLCGHNPAVEVQALASRQIEVTGSVPSVSEYLKNAAVVMNPLKHGAGTSLKVLEALASGAPLITSTVGIRGYPEAIVKNSLLADSVGDMAAAIIATLAAPALVNETAKRARREAEAYDWGALSTRFEALVQQAC